MTTHEASLAHCLSFVNCQLQPPDGKSYAQKFIPHPRAVTISRQAGCGALVVAEKLAALLQARGPKDAPQWTIFDKNLMAKVLEDHKLSARFAKYLPEDRMTELQDIVDEVSGLRPPSTVIIQQTVETVLKLAELGSVILVGHGASVVAARMADTFHVRLVAPLDQRIEHICRTNNVSPKDAKAFCQREDRGRERYLKKYFHADINDPLHYHMVINTGKLSYDEVARAIAETAFAKKQET